MGKKRTGKRPSGKTPHRPASKPRAADSPAPAPSPRYTPAPARGLFRPTWHRAVGGAFVLGGVALFVLNDLALFGTQVIPGGHNELYALLAFLVAGVGTWWFGWYDRPQGRW